MGVPLQPASDRMHTEYAGLICDMAQDLFTVSIRAQAGAAGDPAPWKRKRHGVRLRSVVRDGVTSFRTFG